jgi:hypothetical protein
LSQQAGSRCSCRHVPRPSDPAANVAAWGRLLAGRRQPRWPPSFHANPITPPTSRPGGGFLREDRRPGTRCRSPPSRRSTPIRSRRQRRGLRGSTCHDEVARRRRRLRLPPSFPANPSTPPTSRAGGDFAAPGSQLRLPPTFPANPITPPTSRPGGDFSQLWRFHYLCGGVMMCISGKRANSLAAGRW